MKKAVLFLFIIFISFFAMGQKIDGSWNGILKIQDIELRIVFNIKYLDNHYVATMDSPDQGVIGIAVDSVMFDKNILRIRINNIKMEYEGKLNADNIFEGVFKQGMIIPLNLKKEDIVKLKPKRPQEPKSPYPYKVEEVVFKNIRDNIRLSGTFTIPHRKGSFPTVILISGSGPQDRDEELFNHKPFLVIADYLTRNGIAVLRFDDRGVAKSEGDFNSATSEDFSYDVEAAIDFLKTRQEVDKNRIGLIGHSEGAMIAPIVANRNKSISFVVMLGAPGLSGLEISLLQSKYMGKLSGITEEALNMAYEINKGALSIVIGSKNDNELKRDLRVFFSELLEKHPNISAGMPNDKYIEMQLKSLTSTWMKYFLRYNPIIDLEKLKCPALVLNGEKDCQVPSKENLGAIRKVFRKVGKNNATVKELKGLNHLFQECVSGSPNEYMKIEQTFSPKALEIISEWILSLNL